VNIHYFGSTEEGYDDSQCRDDIKFGDILVVESEQVVGFLLSAWPLAVTEEHGEFHSKDPNYPWSSFVVEKGIDYPASIAKAMEIAKEKGWKVSGT
jgi:hypothetical protein